MVIMNSTLCINQIRRVSQQVLEKLRHIPSKGLVWKANQHDPRLHDSAHEGLFYQLPAEKEIMQIFGHPSPYDIETTQFYKLIGQMPLMIRRPALSAMDYIKRIEPEQPNTRLLFYGDKGRGKTHTLTHLIHYLHNEQKYFIIHIREIKKFTRSPWEIEPSTSRKGRFDTPLNSAILLQQLRLQNATLFDQLKDTLVCSKDYQWSAREVTKAGEPLMNVAEHGVNRINHASDCVAVLINELMLAADEGKIRLVSVIDNVNFLFKDKAGVLKHPDSKAIMVDEITVARSLKKLIKGIHRGGLTLASCDDKLSDAQNQTPRQVLGIEGWNHFDPFLPIDVPVYSRKEFESCMNFYQDIGWLTRPESRTLEVRDEIRFASGLNPGQVHYLCSAI